MSNQQELKMNFKWRFDADQNLDAVELQRFVKTISLLGIDSGYVVDSYTMSAGGPVLDSLFVFGGGYIVEIRLSDKGLHFDAADIKKVVNYRVKYLEHIQTSEVVATEATEGDQVPQSTITEFVQISIAHSDQLLTQLTYFGPDLDDWVRFCMQAAPPSNLIR